MNILCYDERMMRIMGIDFGTKRVGVAVSDSENKFAIPNVVLENKKDLINKLNDIVCENEIGTIVLGDSKNFRMQDNEVMGEIRKFKEEIENKLGKPVVWESEMFTSAAAERSQGKSPLLDASAAALILQSYLDRLNP